jgi:lipopolysaccharide export LptBFGC system permease protein LptF
MFLSDDDRGSLICAPIYDVNSCIFRHPTIITRERTEKPGIWKVTGRITAEKMVYNHTTQQWDLIKGRQLSHADSVLKAVASYNSKGLIPKYIPVMLKAKYKALLSSKQIHALESQNPKDVVQLLSQKHFRITDPIINFVTLMVCLPILVCRDPRSMKSAVMISFGLTTVCSLVTFTCKMLATEEMFFSRCMPEFWAWLPILIFLPIAFIELDSMKT